MSKTLINSLVANQNTIALSAIAITTIGGSIAMAVMFRVAKKDIDSINEIVTEFNKNYAS
jgi:hypothetical protein